MAEDQHEELFSYDQLFVSHTYDPSHITVSLFGAMVTWSKPFTAFISSRLDYCNALYFGINRTLLNRLHLVQKVAARLLTNTWKHDHLLCNIHWLPAENRVHLKLLLFCFLVLYVALDHTALCSTGQHLLGVRDMQLFIYLFITFFLTRVFLDF